MKYIVIFLILIGFCGIASGQYLGDKLPRGTMLPDYDGDYLFPPNYVDFYYSEPRFDHYYVTEGVYRYDIPYMISNGTISSMNVNCSDTELTLSIKPSGNKGWITLALPRLLVDSKMDISNDDDFFVLLDSKEVSHPDISSEKLRILIIPFYDDTSQINVIGVNYPEHAGENACEKKHEPPFSYLLSPLKQFKSGVVVDEIQCKQNLVLIQKYDGSPACVTEQTKQKLVERGWAGTPHVDIIQKVPSVYLDPADISSASNQFAIDYYSNLTQNDSTSNVFFSPTSISTAFSILYEGARQDTSQEIQNVFGFPEDEQSRKHGYLSLHQSINKQSNTNTTLSIANALWLAENFEPLAEYIDTATTYYDSTVSTVDFVSDEGVDKINEWVDKKTQGKIPDILKPGSTGSSTKMAITNAIYFKGMWEHQFDPEDTYESEFMVNKDNSVKIQMMTFPHKMQVNYAVTEKMEMIELPYRNGTVSMLIILPNKIDDLKTVEESLTIDNLKKWKEFPTINRGINIHIPKFTLETEYDLTKQLPDMGMPTVFNPVHADLSGITGYKSLYVSQAIHKAFVEVNEKGTEAAGATVIVTNESGGPTFMADHPFIFIIWDNKTDSILFMGRVTNPTE